MHIPDTDQPRHELRSNTKNDRFEKVSYSRHGPTEIKMSQHLLFTHPVYVASRYYQQNLPFSLSLSENTYIHSHPHEILVPLCFLLLFLAFLVVWRCSLSLGIQTPPVPRRGLSNTSQHSLPPSPSLSLSLSSISLTCTRAVWEAASAPPQCLFAGAAPDGSRPGQAADDPRPPALSGCRASPDT